MFIMGINLESNFLYAYACMCLRVFATKILLQLIIAYDVFAKLCMREGTMFLTIFLIIFFFKLFRK